MKRNVILLVDADADIVNLGLVAAADQALDVRLARSSRGGFGMLNCSVDDVALIIIDLGSGVHAMELLEALRRETQTPSIIAIASFEGRLMREIARAHGAAICLDKPVSGKRLGEAIATATKLAQETCGDSSDVWGHLCAGGGREAAISNRTAVACALAA
jgi:DNA-binding response OmpR family regulator